MCLLKKPKTYVTLDSMECTLASPVVIGLIVFLIFLLASCQASKTGSGYSKIQGYFAIFNPIAGYNNPTNFSDSYVVGFPIGVFSISYGVGIGMSFKQL